jgi:hypothetical protein
MTTTTITYTGHLVTTSCWCGVALAVPQSLYDEARRNGRGIYCPLGHTFVYSDTTKKELERTRNRLQATQELLAAEERSHHATKGHLTRQRKRAAAAICPCCHRSFVQLRRHMATKHPDYQP